MKLTIDFSFPKSDWKIAPTSEIIFLGSCFAEEVGSRLQNDGFSVVQNPFGVIFHPIPLARILQKAIQGDTTTNILQRDDVFFSWDASGTFFAYQEEELLHLFQTTLQQFQNQLRQADVLAVTFGTAFGYRLLATNQLVSNCHKQAKESFRKELTEVETMVNEWQKTLHLLKAFNPDLHIIFTVSPTKHLKDGVVENVRSKARLIEVAHQLNQNYFPSFEIVQEVLRDYRFYKADGAHPNETAVDEVYRIFQETYFNIDASEFQKDISKFKQLQAHRLLYPESQQAKDFRLQIEKMKRVILKKYPFVKL